MEANFEEHVQERAVLVGLNADCFKKDQTATEETLEELEALLQIPEPQNHRFHRGRDHGVIHTQFS